MKALRIQEIQQYIFEHQNVSLETLCSIFKVSKNTIRRDIDELEKNGIVLKVYGGVTANNKEVTTPFNQRENINKLQKQSIGQLASTLITNGDIIFIDSGSTTMHMIPYLSNKKDITIITNSLTILEAALPYPNLNVLCCGGTLSRKTNSLIGLKTLNFLKNYNISKSFMSATGISIEIGVTNSSSFESEIKRAILEKSNEIILLTDNSKFDKVSLITYCDLTDIDILVTDTMPSQLYTNFFSKNNIKLLISDTTDKMLE